LSAIDYLIFVNSDNPEDIVLGILADFKEEDPENALKQILQRIEETTDTDFSLQRYFNQLRILAQLRNLDLKLKNAMDSIAKHIKEERDVLYLRGRDKEKEILIINLLKQTDFNFEKIANLANATVDFVKSVKQKLSADNQVADTVV
jgi:DNA-dependent RNA polymerase auxiliary subunit epsilon